MRSTHTSMPLKEEFPPQPWAEYFQADPVATQRLQLLTQASPALQRHLEQYPDDLAVVLDPLQYPATFAGAQTVAQLRLQYRSHLVAVAVRDLAGLQDLSTTMFELSSLADAAIVSAQEIAAEQIVSEQPEFQQVASQTPFSVLMLGKGGAQELNYVSDVDVIFVINPPPELSAPEQQQALSWATMLAQRLIQILSQPGEEPALWQVDTALRPEGKNGPLVRTMASYADYYEKWAQSWEFQALLKARYCAGDAQLGQEFVSFAAEQVWQASRREDFVGEVRRMRQRVIGQLAPAQRETQLKLGPGGLRDVEFCVQLLQLVHGRDDPSLHQRATLPALAALCDGGYIGREDAHTFSQAYVFLRTVEHRLQLRALRRVQTLPREEKALRDLALSLGYRLDPVATLRQRWQQHRRQVRDIHEKLFYRPLLEAMATLEQPVGAGGQLTLSPQAAKARLFALGYEQPEAALQHIQVLTSGISRRAALQRVVLPVMLSWFGDAPDPDQALLSFRRVSERLQQSSWFLRALRDGSVAAKALARVMSASPVTADWLLREPQLVEQLMVSIELPTREQLERRVSLLRPELASADFPSRLRRFYQREATLLAMAWLTGQSDDVTVSRHLSQLMDLTLAGALEHTLAELAPLPPEFEFAMMAVGRWGGQELTFGSDADVLCCYRMGDSTTAAAAAQAATLAEEVVRRLRHVCSTGGVGYPLELDFDLRPEGKQGPLVRSLAAYERYYERWSQPWERQVLLRARPVTGSVALLDDWLALVDEVRWGRPAITAEQVHQLRRLKARVEVERLPRGSNPKFNLKLGPGGLSDIEWAVQYFQLRKPTDPARHVVDTLELLEVMEQQQELTSGHVSVLRSSWLQASRMRNAMMLTRGRVGDQLPPDAAGQAQLAYVLREASEDGELLLNDRLRTARKARHIFEEYFFGMSPELEEDALL